MTEAPITYIELPWEPLDYQPFWRLILAEKVAVCLKEQGFEEMAESFEGQTAKLKELGSVERAARRYVHLVKNGGRVPLSHVLFLGSKVSGLAPVASESRPVKTASLAELETFLSHVYREKNRGAETLPIPLKIELRWEDGTHYCDIFTPTGEQLREGGFLLNQVLHFIAVESGYKPANDGEGDSWNELINRDNFYHNLLLAYEVK